MNLSANSYNRNANVMTMLNWPVYGYAKWHLDMCINQGLKKGFFVSIWTSAGEFWTSAVQQRDKL